MIKVVLIDDEELILKVLLKSIEWHKYNMKIVDTFTDGIKAYNYLLRNDVNIVFIDMRMPKLRGYDLIGKIHTLKPSINFVALSAYDDFHSVKTAFKNGAMDYILKINIDSIQMVELLTKLKNMYIEHENNSEQALMNYINQITSNNCYSATTNLSVFSIQPIMNTRTEEIKQCLNTLKKTYAIHWIRYEGRYIVFVIRSSESIEQLIINHLLHIEKCHIGVSAIMQLTEGYEAYRRSVKALERAWFYNCVLCYYNHGKTGKDISKLFIKVKEDLYQHMMVMDWAKLEDDVLNLSRQITKEMYDPCIIVENWKDVYSFMRDILTIMELWPTERHNIFSSSFNKLTYNHVHGFMLSITQDINNKFHHGAVNQRFELIKLYMDNNFHRNISMYEVADKFNISQSHLSKQFKKLYKVNCNQYLNMLKIEKSKVLLIRKDARISGVYDKVGFENVEHFSRVFKKLVGVSPSTYMKEYQQ